MVLIEQDFISSVYHESKLHAVQVYSVAQNILYRNAVFIYTIRFQLNKVYIKLYFQ